MLWSRQTCANIWTGKTSVIGLHSSLYCDWVLTMTPFLFLLLVGLLNKSNFHYGFKLFNYVILFGANASFIYEFVYAIVNGWNLRMIYWNTIIFISFDRFFCLLARWIVSPYLQNRMIHWPTEKQNNYFCINQANRCWFRIILLALTPSQTTELTSFQSNHSIPNRETRFRRCNWSNIKFLTVMKKH